MKYLKYITVPVLFVLFSLAAIFSPAFAIVGAFFSLRYAGNVMHSMDMLAAALLGWNGRATISKECGRELATSSPCRFCRIVCRVLDVVLEAGHCQKEAGK